MADKVLVLRTSDRNRKSYGNFQWPESGPVKALDWNPSPTCGYGLHGALWGEGDGSLFDWSDDATWQVVEVDADSVVDLKGKVKFPRGEVIFSGSRKGATEMILSHPDGEGRAVIGAYVIAEHDTTATVGDFGMATAGKEGVAIAGYGGVATVGNCGRAAAGDHGKAAAGDYGTARAGDGGTVTAGYEGTALAGFGGKAVAGDRSNATAESWGTATAGTLGKATAGNYGMATAGAGGIATAGVCGTAIVDDGGMAIVGDGGKAQAGTGGAARAGHRGRIIIEWYDTKVERHRIATGYIGENGLLPNTLYKVDGKGNFVPAEQW